MAEPRSDAVLRFFANTAGTPAAAADDFESLRGQFGAAPAPEPVAGAANMGDVLAALNGRPSQAAGTEFDTSPMQSPGHGQGPRITPTGHVATPGEPLPPMPTRPRHTGGGGGAARVNIPSEYANGQYFTGEEGELEAAYIGGDISEAQMAKLEPMREQYMHSAAGLGDAMVRQGARDERELFDISKESMEAREDFTTEQKRSLQEQGDAAKIAELERKDRQEAYEKDYQVELDKYETFVQEASAEIDPDHYKKELGLGGMVQLRARGMLGALGAGLLGQPDQVAASIERRIDRSIDAQKFNRKMKGAKANAQLNIMSKLRQKYGDDETAALAAKRFMLEDAKRDLAQLSLDVTSADQRAKIKTLEAGIEQRARMSEMGLKQRAKMRADAIEAARRRAAMLAALARRKREEEKLNRGKDLDARYVRGLGGFAGDATRAAHLQEDLASTNEVSQLIQKLRTISKHGGNLKSIPGALKAEARALSAALVAKVNRGWRLGAMDKGALAILNQAAVDPTKFASMDSSNLAALTALQATVTNGMQAQIRAAGLIPAQRVMTTKGAAYVYGQQNEVDGHLPYQVDFQRMR